MKSKIDGVYNFTTSPWTLVVSVTLLAAASLRNNRLTKGARTLSFLGLAAVLAVFGGEVVWYLHGISEPYWWAFLLLGGSYCLLLILFNSEELTERWLRVVGKSAAGAGIAIFVLLVFYCFALHRTSSQRSQQAREQSDKDKQVSREAIDQYFSNPALTTRTSHLLARSNELLSSDREIALQMARFLHREAKPLVPQQKLDILSEVFPEPRTTPSRKRWRLVRETITAPGAGEFPTFENSLELFLFGSESMRKTVPYKTYINLLREERYPYQPSTKRILLTSDFAGSLKEFKGQLRARTYPEIDALSPHCEVFYGGNSPELIGRANDIVDELRRQNVGKPLQFIVPQAQHGIVADGSKPAGTNLYVFASGRSEYHENVADLSSRIFGKEAAADKELVSRLCEIPWDVYIPYTSYGYKLGSPRSILQQAEAIDSITSKNVFSLPPQTRSQLLHRYSIASEDAVSKAVPELRRKASNLRMAAAHLESSLKARVFRERTTLNILWEYGNPERHFEIWVLPEGPQATVTPE